MKIPVFIVSSVILCACAHATVPAAVNPYTFLGRVMDARHAAFDTNRVASIEVADSAGAVLASTKTFFRADSRRNYVLAVPMATTAVTGCAVQGNALSVAVTDDLGKVWRGVVVDATAGAPGAVREVDIVLGEDANGDGIDDDLYKELESQWEVSDYWGADIKFDPNADYDGDGVSTLAEALSGTDPFNQDDVLKITAFTYYPAAARSVQSVSLAFTGVAGRSYTVEEATDLKKKDWKKSSFETVESATPVNVISLSSKAGAKALTVYLLPTSSTNGFYRVKAE